MPTLASHLTRDQLDAVRAAMALPTYAAMRAALAPIREAWVLAMVGPAPERSKANWTAWYAWRQRDQGARETFDMLVHEAMSDLRTCGVGGMAEEAE